MDISKLIKIGVIGLMVLVLSFYLGLGAATEQKATVVKVILIIGALACIASGTRIWLIIPLAEHTSVMIIRGFSFFELSQITFVVMCLLMFLMRRLPIKARWGELDFWIGITLFCLLQTYMRAPIGLNMFGAEVMGGRPYLLIAITFGTYLFLGNFRINAKELKWAMWLNVLGVFASMPLNKLRWGSFSGGGEVGSGNDYTTLSTYNYGAESATRDGSRGTMAMVMGRAIIAFKSPLLACLHPLFAPLVLLTLFLAATSGYRHIIGHIGLIYIVGIAYRGGFIQVIISSVTLGTAIVLLAFLNLIHPLPPNVQRVLTIFPGTWEERIKDGASRSTEWRITMWEKALFTDKYINNKIIGDGLGITRIQLRNMLAEEEIGSGIDRDGLTGQQRNLMTAGGYHSGPVESIRAVGFIGLIFMWLAMARVAVHAHYQIMRCKGTEWYPVALFFGVPIIAYPFFWTFIFGTYGDGMRALLLSVSYLKLMQYNLPLPAYVRSSRRAYQPLLTRQAQPSTVSKHG